MAKKKKPEHYIDNDEFLAAMVDFKKAVAEAEKTGTERPMVSNYIGECFLKLATHRAQQRNFRDYTFIGGMIMDGVENCLRYIDNFDPDISGNPFSYFTQIIYYSFLRRIAKEKKSLYIKLKATERANIFSETSDFNPHDVTTYNASDVALNEWAQRFVEDFETNVRKKKLEQKRKAKKKVK
tara:strand:- start:455 stop:1000 length:546 start_codon:yes stop_codon:yes gene_type:complete